MPDADQASPLGDLRLPCSKPKVAASHKNLPRCVQREATIRELLLKLAFALQDPLPIHRQSVYLFGRERRVADIPTDHPSCSKQHSVLQFRRVCRPDQRKQLLQHLAASCHCRCQCQLPHCQSTCMLS
jgi:hypothetical protein